MYLSTPSIYGLPSILNMLKVSSFLILLLCILINIFLCSYQKF